MESLYAAYMLFLLALLRLLVNHDMNNAMNIVYRSKETDRVGCISLVENELWSALSAEGVWGTVLRGINQGDG